MSGPYESKAVANALLMRASAANQAVDHMKLQKMIYFIHGYYLAATKAETGTARPAVNEFFEAWDYGPVLPSIYHEFKQFGGSPIPSLAIDMGTSTGGPTTVTPPADDPLFEKILSFVWETNASRAAMTLSRLTHKTGGAWDKTHTAAKGLRGADIPNELILKDFEPFVTKKKAA